MNEKTEWPFRFYKIVEEKRCSRSYQIINEGKSIHLPLISPYKSITELWITYTKLLCIKHIKESTMQASVMIAHCLLLVSRDYRMWSNPLYYTLKNIIILSTSFQYIQNGICFHFTTHPSYHNFHTERAIIQISNRPTIKT